MSEVLVSIAIITYNSSKYVIEALNSVKEQIYKNIELIISDDCSKDNTVFLIHNWITENKNTFSKIEFLTVQKNTGICANHNRALRYCKGEWIKFVAGDDKLTGKSINDFVNFTFKEPSARFILGGLQNFDKQQYYEPPIVFSEFRDASVAEQYKYVLMSSTTFPGPAMFYHRETLISLGGFNEEYNFIEDTPLWYKILQNGFKIYSTDAICVQQRSHKESLSSTNSIDNPFTRDARRFIKNVMLQECIKNKLYLIFWHKLLNYWLSNPKEMLFIRHKYRIKKYILFWIDPYSWIYGNKNNWIRKIDLENLP